MTQVWLVRGWNGGEGEERGRRREKRGKSCARKILIGRRVGGYSRSKRGFGEKKKGGGGGVGGFGVF